MANQVELTKEQALQILKSKKQVSNVGVRYSLRVTNITDYTNPETQERVFIVNLAAQTPYHRQQSIAKLQEGEWTEAANFGLSANRRPGKDWVPQKGEIVNVILDTFITKDGEEAIGVASMTPVEAAKAEVFDFAAFAGEEATVEAAAEQPLV